MRLWCPHLLVGMGRLARRSALAWTRTRHLAAPLRTHAHAFTPRCATDTAASLYLCAHQCTYAHCCHRHLEQAWPCVQTRPHWLNLHTQKPRATTSLSAAKPGNYVRPLSVFILPRPTVHYPHHLLPSNFGSISLTGSHD